MPQLPRIEAANAGKLNAGPRHPKNAHFSSHLHDRLWKDNSLAAERRRDATDERAQERARRRRNAADDAAKRREKRLKTLERRMKDDAARVAALEAAVRRQVRGPARDSRVEMRVSFAPPRVPRG